MNIVYGRNISDEVTTVLPVPEKPLSEHETVAVPVVSGYMQERYNDRLIELLAQLCSNPEQFKKEASHV